MLPRIAYHVRHPRFAPTRVDILVAFLASSRAGIVRGRRYTRRRVSLPRSERRHVRQMTNVGNELPNLPVRQLPGGHARIPDAVSDVIKNLAVRHRRDVHRSQRRRTRILAQTDLGLSITVVAVAGLTLLAEHVMAGRDFGRIVRQRIGARFCFRRNTPVKKPGRDLGLDRPRLRASARQPRHEPLIQGAGPDDEGDDETERNRKRA